MSARQDYLDWPYFVQACPHAPPMAISSGFPGATISFVCPFCGFIEVQLPE